MAGIEMTKVGFTNFLNELESGTLDGKSIAMILGGITISALSGKNMVSSGRAMMACLDNAGKAAKGKGWLTDGDVSGKPVEGGGNFPKNKTFLWGQEKYVTEKGLNTVKQHLSGDLSDEFNDAMINRLETAYKNNTKISGADLDFYAHEIYEFNMMKNGMSYDNAHELDKAYYNAVEFNFYHPEVIKQYLKLFKNAWF